MPVMSGIELLNLLVAQGAQSRSFHHSLPDESVREQALKSGAICFLTKPFDGQTLIMCLGTSPREVNGQTTR